MSFNEALNPYFKIAAAHPLIHTKFEEVSASFVGQYSILDLGCGNGHFLEGYLASIPNSSGLGVERRFKRSVKTADKLHEVNGRVLQMEISQFFEECPSSFWDEIWLQFPDPWPKTRHEKNRTISTRFLPQIRRLLKAGGRFCFRSDCRPYWEILQVENIRQGFFPIVKSQKGDLFSEVPKTLYQKKFLTAGIPIYSLEFRRLE